VSGEVVGVPYVPESLVKHKIEKWRRHGDLAEALAGSMESLIDLYFFMLRLETRMRSVKQKGGEGG
jgi:hypothetical protein